MINWLKTNNRWQAVVGLLLLIGAYAVGRWASPEKVITKTVTVEVEKKQEKTNTVIVKVTKPDGTVTETTTTNTETNTETKTKDKSETIVQNKKQSLHISALAGLDVTNPAGGFVFGAHVSKQILGPVSIGLFGLTNKTVGASIGLSF